MSFNNTFFVSCFGHTSLSEFSRRKSKRLPAVQTSIFQEQTNVQLHGGKNPIVLYWEMELQDDLHVNNEPTATSLQRFNWSDPLPEHETFSKTTLYIYEVFLILSLLSIFLIGHPFFPPIFSFFLGCNFCVVVYSVWHLHCLPNLGFYPFLRLYIPIFSIFLKLDILFSFFPPLFLKSNKFFRL